MIACRPSEEETPKQRQVAADVEREDHESPSPVVMKISHTSIWLFLMMDNKLPVSMEKTHVNKMVVAAGAVAAIAGGYYGVNFYKNRQSALVEEFALSMMLYWGDAAASK
jgi:hypothetical protein